MRRRGIVLVAVFWASVAVCAFAAEPWKSKDYEKWTSKEVERILNDSPWAHTMGTPRAAFTDGDAPASSAQMGTGGSNSASDSSQGPNSFVLRWNSSMTIRRALYRQAVLKGSDPAAAQESYLSEMDADAYELVIVSSAGTVLPWDSTTTLTKDTYLEFEPSKTRVSPTTAKVQEMVDARGHRGFVFWFPKQRSDGKPAIPDGTASVLFHMHIGPSILMTVFKPAEMIGADGPDVR